MANNLIRANWTELDSAELRIVLDKRIGGVGQYDRRVENHRNKLYLPLAGTTCKIVLTFKGDEILAIEPGAAFDAEEWRSIEEEIEKSILVGPVKIGREFSFSTSRVQGSWCGLRSGIQILPAPADAPRADVEIADHPFILEFPIQATDFWQMTNHRRMREHRKLSLVLNILLRARISVQARRHQHFWAIFRHNPIDIRWVQEFFFAQLGEPVLDNLSAPASEKLEEVDPDSYFDMLGHDMEGLRIPADLDESICRYMELAPVSRRKFDRSAYWMDMASHQWDISMSVSFACLVSAIESLTERGQIHRHTCPACGEPCQHEAPGATERFRVFFETYAPGSALRSRRSEMYSLRSSILHGSSLMQLDQDLLIGGWDPPKRNERELHDELWEITQVALRNWLKQARST